MYDTESIGKKISALRKEHNMTQPALADALNVSYQAVSNWERGMSLPDITKLPDLAELFSVSIDELLGKPSELISNISKGKVKEFIENHETDKNELRDAAVLMPPAQVDELAESIPSPGISALLPYMSNDAVEALVVKAYENGESFAAFLPFLSDESVALLAEACRSDGKDISCTLPFLPVEKVGEYAFEAQEKGESLAAYLPFLSDDDLMKLAKLEVKKGRSINMFLPFMPESEIDRMVMEHVGNNPPKTDRNASPLASFFKNRR